MRSDKTRTEEKETLDLIRAHTKPQLDRKSEPMNSMPCRVGLVRDQALPIAVWEAGIASQKLIIFEPSPTPSSAIDKLLQSQDPVN